MPPACSCANAAVRQTMSTSATNAGLHDRINPLLHPELAKDGGWTGSVRNGKVDARNRLLLASTLSRYPLPRSIIQDSVVDSPPPAREIALFGADPGRARVGNPAAPAAAAARRARAEPHGADRFQGPPRHH